MTNRKCGTDEANNEQPKKQYRVTYRETAYYYVDVWAIDEEQADFLAADIELDCPDYWGDMELSEIQEIEE